VTLYNFSKISFLFVLQYFGINKIFRLVNRGKIKVLLYHNIENKKQYFPNSVSTDDFVNQLDHLSKYYNVISLTQSGDWVGVSNSKVNVLVTFDDGFYNNYSVATPILHKKGIKAVFFIIYNCIIDSSPPVFANKYMVSNEDYKKYNTISVSDGVDMIDQGMTIGAHSVSHQDYSKLEFESGMDDARNSAQNLAKLFNMPMNNFCLPWGKSKYNQEKELTKYFNRVFTTKHGFNDCESSVIMRNEVTTNLHMYAATSGALDFFSSLSYFKKLKCD